MCVCLCTRKPSHSLVIFNERERTYMVNDLIDTKNISRYECSFDKNNRDWSLMVKYHDKFNHPLNDVDLIYRQFTDLSLELLMLMPRNAVVSVWRREFILSRPEKFTRSWNVWSVCDDRAEYRNEKTGKRSMRNGWKIDEKR